MPDTQTETNTETATASLVPDDMSVLDKIIADKHMALQADQAPNARVMLARFADQAAKQKIKTNEKGVLKAIELRIAEIDAQLTAGLNAIMHSEKFQALERSWRGLHDLVQNTETSSRLKLRVLNLSEKELCDDLAKAIDVDQSNLFKKIYEEEYGTFGGNPYSVLVGDLTIDRSPASQEMLTNLARVAAMAHAPIIMAADPGLFDMRSFRDLSVPRDLAKTFEGDAMATWRAFRSSEDSRYVALTLPRYLLRLPYGERTVKVDNFAYEEFVEYQIDDPKPNASKEEAAAAKLAAAAVLAKDQDKRHEAYLWGNSCYLLAQRITDAFAKYGWSAAIRGVEGGGMIEGLPVHTFNTGEGDLVMKCPTEVSITDRREKELNDLGFIAVVHKKSENYAAFFGGQTVNKPIVYNKPLANANARLSAQLPCILAASRFAHYIKVIMRDKVGSFASRDNVEIFLNNWIADYVLVNDNASQSVKAQYPLRAARIDVTEDAGKPGVYKATVFLRPHFQLEELTASIRMVAELPAPAGA